MPDSERLFRGLVTVRGVIWYKSAIGGRIAAVTLQLGKAAIIDLPTVLIAAVAFVLLFRFRWNSAWFMLAGALSGLTVKAVM